MKRDGSPHGVYYISPLMTEPMLSVYLCSVLAKRQRERERRENQVRIHNRKSEERTLSIRSRSWSRSWSRRGRGWREGKRTFGIHLGLTCVARRRREGCGVAVALQTLRRGDLYQKTRFNANEEEEKKRKRRRMKMRTRGEKTKNSKKRNRAGEAAVGGGGGVGGGRRVGREGGVGVKSTREEDVDLGAIVNSNCHNSESDRKNRRVCVIIGGIAMCRKKSRPMRRR